MTAPIVERDGRQRDVVVVGGGQARLTVRTTTRRPTTWSTTSRATTPPRELGPRDALTAPTHARQWRADRLQHVEMAVALASIPAQT